MSQQLVKKGANGRHENVMPKSWIEAIKDKNTGQTLVEVLQGFNMYFLPYNGNTSSTRCLVPTTLRKKGLWVTYVKYDGNVYTEWYAADEIDDTSWGDSSNWRIGNNTLVGDITISANGNWVINGTETEFKAVGEKGNTPLLRVANNRLQVSYDLGDTYMSVTENPVYTQFRNHNNKIQISTDLGATWTDASDEIAAYFRWQATSGDTQANNVGRVQISRDNKTWVNLSNDIINNLHISRYIGVNESLPTSGIAEGTIYAKGPTYDTSDTSHSNPIYRLWVYAWKDNTLAWQDNGEFTSIAAGVVQDTGNSETEVMSQKAVTEKLGKLKSEVYTKRVDFDRGSYIDFYKNEILTESTELETFTMWTIGSIKAVPNTTYEVTLKNTSYQLYYKISDFYGNKISDGNGKTINTPKDDNTIITLYLIDYYKTGVSPIPFILVEHNRNRIASIYEFGEIKAEKRTEDDKVEIHIDSETGKLYTQPAQNQTIIDYERNQYIGSASIIIGSAKWWEISSIEVIPNTLYCVYSTVSPSGFSIYGRWFTSTGSMISDFTENGDKISPNEANKLSLYFIDWSGSLPAPIGDIKISHKNVFNIQTQEKKSWLDGKNIWWCGTSIPAGGETGLGNSYSYPVICGNMLGCSNSYNEAVGSSMAKSSVLSNSWNRKLKSMGDTIQQKLEWFSDLWIIDDINKTVNTGPRKLGIVDFPIISSYAEAIALRARMIKMSYEIKLVSKYLISDAEDNKNFLQEKLGSVYDYLTEDVKSSISYQGDISMFVFDHGHNDGSSPVETSLINSEDMSTFVGAINNFIRLIYYYKPDSRIVYVSDYDNEYGTNSSVIEAQKQIADNWHIPFIDLRNYLPFNNNFKVRTRGYWGTDYDWHNEGFTWDDSVESIVWSVNDSNVWTNNVTGDMAFMSRIKELAGDTLESLTNFLNPTIIDNVWTYELSPRHMWIMDGIHPHQGWRYKKPIYLYSKVLYYWIKQLGDSSLVL